MSTLMPPIAKTARQVRQKIAEIHHALATVQHLASGTLSKRTKVCGHPQCRCASDPAARHGPYYDWTYRKGGKLRHQALSADQADLMAVAIANYRKVKRLLRAWEVQTLRLIKLNAPK
jgi:hypothetical protein